MAKIDKDVWDGFYCFYAQCPKCGKFTGYNKFWINKLDIIVKAEGRCKIHKTVNILETSEYGWF